MQVRKQHLELDMEQRTVQLSVEQQTAGSKQQQQQVPNRERSMSRLYIVTLLI